MAGGLQFRNVDLHVHTPASHCFVEPAVTPKAIVEQAIRVGMHAIAITDHNSAEWVDRVMQAAKDTDLIVFPGTEITVQPGVHVIAIFPEYCTGGHVTDLLAELGIHAEHRGDCIAIVTRYGIQEVVSIICRHKALAVLAHIDDVKGAWHELRDKGQTLIQLWQAAEFSAVEIVGDSLPEKIGRPPFEHYPAYYWASDDPHPEDPTKHSHRGIGTRYSCFKLNSPITWEGLRQCLGDPEVRIRRGRPAINEVTQHPVITRIEIRGGFLSDLRLNLSPGLNCIIGGRGTGKSALLEIVRYAFDVAPKTEMSGRQADSLINYAFPTGSHVTVDFRLSGGMTYRVERIAGREPLVYRADDVESAPSTPLDVKPADLLPLQVYGQKEVYEISQDPQFQLNLLDNYVEEALRPFEREEYRILSELRDNSDSILRLNESITSAEQWVTRLGAIKEELLRMEKQGFVSRVENKQHYDREQHLLDQVQAQVSDLTLALERFLQEHRLNADALAEDLLTDLPNQNTLRMQRGLLEAIDTFLEQAFRTLEDQIEAKWAEGQAARTAWREAYEAQNEEYRELLREFQGTGQAVSPDRYIQLQQRRIEFEGRHREIEQQKVQMRELYAKRRSLLQRLREVRREQYTIRRRKAAELTQLLMKSVRITVHPEGNRVAYQNYLRDLFAGLNVRNPYRDKLAEIKADEPEREAQHPVMSQGGTRYLVPEIPCYLDPIDLANAIRVEQERKDEEESLLESHFDIESDAMRRNLAGLSLRQIFELETFSVPDLPIIELHVAPGELGYRHLSELSVGQKCTALLSLVLLESSAPLLIDQPEDDLDNQFIFDQIVATLRREKEKRQFLVATHNANIPVSGDAELIIVLQAALAHGWIDEPSTGSIDDEHVKKSVALILEGGKDAFQKRKDKYGY